MSNLAFMKTGLKPNLVPETTRHDIEDSVIKMLFTSKSETFKKLDVGDFDKIVNKRIFKECIKLGFKDLSIDKINYTVKDLDPNYIESLKDSNTKDMEQLVRHFIEFSVKRRVKELQYKMEYSNKDDIDKQILIQNNRVSAELHNMDDVIAEAKERIEFIQMYGYGLQTHISALNTYVKGFGSGQLIIIGGATSMGKTALGMNIASHISDTHHVAFFSLEMTREQLAIRLARAECGNDDTQIDKSLDMLKDKKLTIFDEAYLSIDEIENTSRNISYKNGLSMIVIDYLQIMRMHKQNKLESLEDITARLKRLAKELHIPIILISQLNRNVKDRVVKKPEMSDLRASGSIEQDADVILLIYRGSYYTPDKKSEKGKADIIVAKNREGETGTVACIFDANRTMFKGSVSDKIIGGLSNENVSLREKLLKGEK